ncbi:MAG: hypothetical protein LUC33_01100 [Prevotellaceae bacterium]|nr:hypothetical protein [Prevotellaceae bacterium]
MKTYTKPSVEVIETETEQMVSLSAVETGASGDYNCLDKGYNCWNDGSSFWGE